MTEALGCLPAAVEILLKRQMLPDKRIKGNLFDILSRAETYHKVTYIKRLHRPPLPLSGFQLSVNPL